MASAAPALYVPACANGAATCTGSNRAAKDPITGQILGTNSSLAVGTLVPNSGQERNGLFQSGKEIADTTYQFPMLNVGPRFGTAWDVSGKQTFVVRGSLGLYFDRPRGGNAQALVGNTFVSSLQTVRYSQLQSLGGLRTQSPAQLTAYEYDSKLPTSTEWSIGTQMMVPWSTSVDVAYVGHHNYNAELTQQINAVDIGSAFDPAKQDPTSAPSATPGASSLAALFPDLVRGYKGYTAIALRTYDGWRKYDAIQFSINRRLRNGISFGFNDAITLRDIARVAPRYDHDAAGNLTVRSDQGALQGLLQDQLQPRHLMKATGLWQLPEIKSTDGVKRALGLDPQRLAAVGRLDGRDRNAVHRRVHLPERRRQREPDRLAGLRRAHPHRRRSRRRLQQQPVRAVHTPRLSRVRWSAARASNRRTTT